MIVVGAALLVLGALEIGEHVLVRPADIAELAPHVEVLRLPAHVEQAVDGAGAAEHAAARPGDGAAVEMRLRPRAELPGTRRIGEVAVVAGGNVDPGVAVAPAGLDQGDLDGRVLAQPVRQHAACRARAHDDIVEGCAVHAQQFPQIFLSNNDCRLAVAGCQDSCRQRMRVTAGTRGTNSLIARSFWRPIRATIRQQLRGGNAPQRELRPAQQNGPTLREITHVRLAKEARRASSGTSTSARRSGTGAKHGATACVAARHAAGQHMNAAGVALAAGSRAAGSAARDGAIAGAGALGLGLQAAWSMLVHGLGVLWSLLARGLELVMRPVLQAVARPNIGGPVALAGAIALGAGIGRSRSIGFDREALITLAIGVVLLAALLPMLSHMTGWRMPRLPALSGGAPQQPALCWLRSAAAAWFASGGRLRQAGRRQQPALHRRQVGCRGGPMPWAPTPCASAATTVRLAGIEAPEPEQRCGTGGTRPGAAARPPSRRCRGLSADAA